MRGRFFLIFALIFAWPVLALADNVSVSNLPNKGVVTLSGAIDSIESKSEFILRDDSGTIKVNLLTPSSQPLKIGLKVSVSGSMVEGFFGNASRSIDANNVMIEAAPMLKGAEAQAAAVGIKSLRINELPAEGLVKVSGNVGRVSDPRNFTLRDTTGDIDVDVDDSEKAGFVAGAGVTVIGYIEKGGNTKSIHATRVLVGQTSVSSAGGG